MKTLVSFCAFFIFQICFGQNTLPSDLVFQDLKGKVKSVEEKIINPEMFESKKNYIFDKNGLLNSIREYSVYIINEDSIIQSIVYNYENSNNERKVTTRNTKDNSITSTGTYRIMKPNFYSLKIVMDNGMTSHSEYELDNDLIKSEKNVTFDEDEVQLTDYNIDFIYVDNVLSKIIQTTSASKTEKIATVETTEIDEYGNFRNQKYFDESNTLLYEIKRKITYYD